MYPTLTEYRPMAKAELTYAKVGGPPEDWSGLEIMNLETGQKVLDVLEVNTVEGWVRTYCRGPDGRYLRDGTDPAEQRVEGRFEIRRPVKP